MEQTILFDFESNLSNLESGPGTPMTTSFSSTAINQTTPPFNLSEDDRRLLYDYYTASNFSPPVETLLILVYSLLTISGFLFNFLMALVILKSDNLRRMPFNLLLLNLCAANIFMSVFCMPFTLVGFLRRGWTLGPALCKIIPTLQVISLKL